MSLVKFIYRHLGWLEAQRWILSGRDSCVMLAAPWHPRGPGPKPQQTTTMAFCFVSPQPRVHAFHAGNPDLAMVPRKVARPNFPWSFTEDIVAAGGLVKELNPLFWVTDSPALVYFWICSRRRPPKSGVTVPWGDLPLRSGYPSAKCLWFNCESPSLCSHTCSFSRQPYNSAKHKSTFGKPHARDGFVTWYHPLYCLSNRDIFPQTSAINSMRSFICAFPECGEVGREVT